MLLLINYNDSRFTRILLIRTMPSWHKDFYKERRMYQNQQMSHNKFIASRSKTATSSKCARVFIMQMAYRIRHFQLNMAPHSFYPASFTFWITIFWKTILDTINDLGKPSHGMGFF